MKKILLSLLPLFLLCFTAHAQEKTTDKVVVAYVTSWTNEVPNAMLMTHINYAFGHVNDTYNGVRIDNAPRLRRIVALKHQNPKLHVLLSIGGWGSGRFSEMASDEFRRKAFATDCRRVCEEYGLDGIDIDWEYPTQSTSGISSSPDDTKNFTLLMKDIRDAIGKRRELTFASVSWAAYVDFPSVLPYLDFVNVMAYDMGSGTKHHAALYPSDISGGMTSSQAVAKHLEAGVPAEKIVLGMPFYGRGVKEVAGYGNYNKVVTLTDYKEKWDDKGKVPYLVDKKGNYVLGYDNPRSLGLKCDYANDNNLRGAMYWDYAGDTKDNVLAKTVCEKILGTVHDAGYAGDYAGNKPRFKALLYYSEYEEEAHVTFAKQAHNFFHKLSYGEGYILDTTKSLSGYDYDKLKEYDVVIMLNRAPSDPTEREAFEKYMENGGGWIGFHAAAYNDRNTHWPWFNEFLGCGQFYCNNWPPQPVLVDNDAPHHPIMRTMPQEFIIPASEWYTWQPGPRENPNVEVLLSISPKMLPLGIKDIIKWGDLPIMWTNKKYRMVYLNMGHGDEAFIDATQNLMFTNALQWVVGQKK